MAAEELDLSVMVANTRERQEAHAKASTYSKTFYVTGGEHINLNDMFIAAEMGNWEREIARDGKKYKGMNRVSREAQCRSCCPWQPPPQAG